MNTPSCIGVIMDGNRRWAKGRGLPTFEGHRKGAQKMKECINWAMESGIGTIIFFAFSEENWNRSEEEVSFMMTLLREMLVDQRDEAKKKNIRMRFIGNIDRFPLDIATSMKDMEQETAQNIACNVVIASSYGGRQEITSMVNKIIASGKTEISSEDVSTHLYTNGLPDPDIIIRTSGEMRLSGFLPWQAVYSELFFLPVMWPDFSREDFTKVIADFNERERRMGK